MSMLFRLFKQGTTYSRLLFAEVLVRSLRGSVLIMGALALLASSSLWLFISSSFAGHDVWRAAHYAPPPTSDVVLIGIDPTGYATFFGGRSPLNRERLVELFHTIEKGASQAHTIAVDLDLRPIPGESGDALDAYFQRTTHQRWLLADPSLTESSQQPGDYQQWRDRWCAAGVRFAYPYIPTAFGQALASHQFKGAFADQALRTDMDCATRVAHHAVLPRQDGLVQLQRTAAPMSAAFMRDGMVLPFQGDLQMLQSMLESLNPQVVVVGGMWGNEDVFLTPFGERHGAHLHAAAIAGQLTQVRIAPLWVQLLAAWWVVTLIAQLLALLYQPLFRLTMPWANTHPGHQFLLRRLWPLGMMAITFGCLLLTAEGGAWLLARTGWWIPTAAIAATVLGAVLFVWNWGLNEIALMDSPQKAFRNIVITPIVKDWQSIRQAGARFLRPAHPASADTPAPGSIEAMPRSHVLMEMLLATISLGTQTLLPLLTVALALTRPV